MSAVSRLLTYCAALVLTLVTFGSITGCGQGQAAARGEDGRILVDFWHGMGRNQGKVLNELVQEYNESQTTYRVVPIYQGGYNSLSQKVVASLYAGRNPALSQTYPGWTTRFFSYGYLKPVSELIEADPEFAATMDDFYPVMIAENTLADPETGEPKLVTLPFNKSVYVLYVNQTLMDELGLEPPKTWDEMLKVAEAMTTRPAPDASPSMYGFATRPFIEDLTVQALAANSQLLDEATGDINVANDDVIAAMEFLERLTTGTDDSRVGYVESSYLSNVFGSERVAMYISSTASFTYNDLAVGDKFIWRAHPIPSKDAETEGRTLMQGTNICIFNNLAPEVEAGAWDFLKWLTSPEPTAKWAQQTGYMPVRRSAKQIDFFAEHMEQDISYANAVSTLERAAFEPRLMYWESVRSLISRQVEAVLLGQKKSGEAMEETYSAIEKIREDAE